MLGAEVTFDVALPKVVWGWLVSTNMWAKSISTGVKMHSSENGFQYLE